MDQVDRVDPDRGDEGDGGTHWGEAVTTATTTPRPGDLAVSPGVGILRGPLVGSDESTPLEEDEPEGIVPPSPLWAMKDRRHIQWHLLPSHERHERVRDCVGAGDRAIYVVDDGRHHVMLGRRVGARRGGVRVLPRRPGHPGPLRRAASRPDGPGRRVRRRHRADALRHRGGGEHPVVERLRRRSLRRRGGHSGRVPAGCAVHRVDRGAGDRGRLTSRRNGRCRTEARAQ